jgi:hypothetical protein
MTDRPTDGMSASDVIWYECPFREMLSVLSCPASNYLLITATAIGNRANYPAG